MGGGKADYVISFLLVVPKANLEDNGMQLNMHIIAFRFGRSCYNTNVSIILSLSALEN